MNYGLGRPEFFCNSLIKKKHMAYERTDKRKRGTNRRTHIPRRTYRTTNAPVRKAYVANRNPRTKAGQNKKAIFTLARQVKKLSAQDEGDVQYQYQRLQLFPWYANPPDMSQMPELNGALGFCANNFYDGASHSPCTMFKGNVDTHGAPTFVGGASFNKNPMLPFTTLGQQYQWQAINATQTVALTEYMPLKARYNFVFTGTAQAAPIGVRTQIRYRVTFFKYRPSKVRINSGLISNVHCPTNLGAFWRMCSDQATNRNYFSKELFQVVADKFIVINRPQITRSAGATGQPPIWTPLDYPTEDFRRSLTFDIPRKHLARGKTLRPNLEPGTLPASANFNTNIPLGEQLWCVISSNLAEDELLSPTCLLNLEINISRALVWRDKHGTATF